MIQRMFIHARDIATLTGFSLRKAQRIVQELRYVLGKEKHQRITIKDFAKHMGIEPAEIILY
ncbi:flagellin-specific chaperone FliS [Pedobacter sp. CG_S7]|uniref:hypothetical protein n=1 Tax=Pedobacter sp. CG_S7 TaxID=3143930 RepID=UPI003398A1A1